jgi:hypothetical protein
MGLARDHTTTAIDLSHPFMKPFQTLRTTLCPNLIRKVS